MRLKVFSITKNEGKKTKCKIAFFIVFFRKGLRALKRLEGNEQIVLLGLMGVVVAFLGLSLGATVIIVGVQDSLLFWFLFGMASGLISKC